VSKEIKPLDDFIGHILVAIDRIDTYVAGITQPQFESHLMAQDAVIRNLEVIGEASRNIMRYYPDFIKGHPELELAPAYQMRNAVSHGYFSVDLDIVWRTVHVSLPVLKQKLVNLNDS